ncbi:Protein CHROMATIN REMODELING 25 [Arabidopsis thaliana]|jgi:DNA repair and recombination RAD54-like protein|uniref:Protein CHROMATIN REMODELING 25 n=4 Tax=Arabidopsis TaxID=3701 RepID=CHR25_ARATH|nr:DNA repair/recombination protein [Arabidopsis thaliana]Q0PCS3.1 RecName: Full=Protein CHROMATIN REMODELING 25; Short=AtCHR25; AltName: Full=DNA repair and recombination protein RAD54; Short=AtRAD54 [Arabidopsis thaliana]KAG7625801.1 SNF2-related N-terminal domain [Arabidopsis thaliana x Arabidopsis arenosa]KAG7631804.1 SNF2-related N-terminal domain [Arabidopsis suecica]ABJ99465.1 RAD54-like protein [Arabidopsis thaliana]AEE76208.1 DNA repair/recombination protein [Arabidopsis thaliana]OAP|eukprot:NP_188552.3 DNA repair/recombination protein [Arabidopsis thaliana]
MEEEDEEILSSSDCDDSSDSYKDDSQDSEGENDNPECEDLAVVSLSSDADRKSKNVKDLLRGNLVVQRQPLLPRVLSVSDGAAVCRKPFKPPCSHGYDSTGQLSRRLSARKRFVPWGSSTPVVVALPTKLEASTNIERDEEEEVVCLPPDIEPLVLWQSEEDGMSNVTTIMVHSVLVKFLRPHQREGVQFMFDCVSGLHGSANINGCILADDMGLGKTLQSITLLYTLLCQGFDGTPMVKKAIIVTPTSLVSNWEAEIKKWVGDRIQLIALCESTRDDVLSGIDSFTRPRSALQVLIISYETFRMHSSKFCQSESCDLLICDEAHRLKNDQTLTNRALASLTCKRRVLLSGTPMQNDLEEFFAMVNFTNPGSLGDAAHFRHYYEAPIICGREPTATEEEKNLAADRSAELSSKVNQFILRRTNALLSNHLPPKIIEVVCCKMTTLQSTLYNHFISSKNLKRALADNAKQTKVLAYITALKKLCNHPKLIYDTIKSGNPGTVGFENCLEFFPAEMFSGRSGAWTGGDGAWVELSGKMHVLSRLLANLRRKTDDRIVLVSNYTQTLDLFAQLCRERRYPFLRLDGSTTISKRQKLVNRLNDPTKDEFAFLLSSKAGGCGLNLIGANRLVLFDPDWNPANDKQAAARVWRDGQKKRVYVYRFLSTGTIEEKVYQRQMSKEGLQKVIQHEQTDNSTRQGNLLSTEDLRDLFSFHGDVRSEIHEKMSCSRCQNDASGTENIEEGNENNVDDNACQIDQEDIGGFAKDAGCFNLLKNSERQVGTPLEEDLGSWGHHFTSKSVPDAILQASAGDEVTFVFTNQVDGKLVPIESNVSPKTVESEEHNRNQPVNKRAFNKPQQRPREPLQPLSLNETTKRVKLSTYKRLHGNSNIDDAQIKMSLQRPNLVSVNHDDDFV